MTNHTLDYIQSREWRTCRMCKELVEEDRLFKYGERHYAHAKCLLSKHGRAGLEKLPTHTIRQFPVSVLADLLSEGKDYTDRQAGILAMSLLKDILRQRKAGIGK